MFTFASFPRRSSEKRIGQSADPKNWPESNPKFGENQDPKKKKIRIQIANEHGKLVITIRVRK
jgi:hypothetical protein